MKSLNFDILNLDAILVTLPIGTGMRQEVPATIAAMFPQGTDLYPLKAEGKRNWAFGYVRQKTTRLKKDLVYFLTKTTRWILNGKPVWAKTAIAEGVYLTECFGVRVLLVQDLSYLPTVLQMTCPKCGRTTWYESAETDDLPKFECACCHQEAVAEQMGVLVGSPGVTKSAEPVRSYGLWARLGVTFRLEREELETILKHGTSIETTEVIRKVLAEGRFYANGDSYIPESMAVIAGDTIDMKVPYESIDFDL
jgi:hypothetical protein